MVSHHFLLSKAFVSNRRGEPKSLTGCRYDGVLGLWLWRKDGDVLVKSSHTDRPRPGTKKEDIETGEDLKGE